jgi:hypothetical protein
MKNKIYLLTQFLVDISQSSNCKNDQRAITLKLGKAEFLFLCNAHLPNDIYIPTNFHVDSSCFKVMFRTRIADGWTDKAATICPSFGKHKKGRATLKNGSHSAIT